MKDTTKRPGNRAGTALAVFASGVLAVVLAATLLPAFAASPSGNDAPKGNRRLASLQIEVWPEFDRPAALVILRGELAADVALPAAVSLRVPASSGGPAAVASATGPGAGLVNMKYESKNAGDFITLSFETPQRMFHVEFYEPLATGAAERTYTYVWPGDLAVNRLSVILQEPAGARDISVQPNLDSTSTGQNGLRYRSAELGALEAGKQLPIKIRYTKTAAQTSTEILQPATKSLQPEPSNASPAPVTGSGDKFRWALVLAFAAALVIGVGAAFLWWQGRGKASGAQPSDTDLCSKCGARLAAGDRFCSRCGAPSAGTKMAPSSKNSKKT